MAKQVLRVARGYTQSLANITAKGVRIDWREAYGEDAEGYEIIRPAPTYGDWAQHGDAPAKVAKVAERFPGRILPEELADEFRGTEAGDQWADTFEPMMNFVWPVALSYDGPGPAALVEMLQTFAPSITLVSFGENSEHCPEEHGFALTGGGMDLSDNIAAAYLCAGCVPPLELLTGLSNTVNKGNGEAMRRRIGPALKVAYRRARGWLAYRSKRLAEESRQVFA